MTEYCIDGLKVMVFDDEFLEADRFDMGARVNNSSFSKVQFSRESGYKYFSSLFDYDVISGTGVYKQTVKLIETHFYKVNHKSAYLNATSFGDITESHIDNPRETVTGLYFVNEIWEHEWGGELIYYNNKREPVLTIQPKYGRLVLADSRLLHIAKSPTRQCTDTRYTLAMKFDKDETI